MQNKDDNSSLNKQYLLCEHRSVFFLLMLTSGMMGAYTFVYRGGVFCNAQTANILMMAVAFGQGEATKGFYYFIPITAYMLGAFVSEILPYPVKNNLRLRWDTCLVGAEMLILLLVGFIPLTASAKIVQVIINFVASMQYNTFRQAEGIPMATTFCTNHVRQIGIALAKLCRARDKAVFKRLMVHVYMITGFCLGAAALCLAGIYLKEKAIWAALVPLFVVFIRFLTADILFEKNELSSKPHGH